MENAVTKTQADGDAGAISVRVVDGKQKTKKAYSTPILKFVGSVKNLTRAPSVV